MRPAPNETTRRIMLVRKGMTWIDENRGENGSKLDVEVSSDVRILEARELVDHTLELL